ncbi:MAG: succinyl-diaminopimelate desuccinylase [Sulfurovaceae bacterium]|nr:succinyl-diaminopimelate desuccinylase [Sulfurovaceae bacterium]
MNVIDILIKLLSYKSITPNDDGALSWIESYLSDYEALYHNKEGVKNLFLTKQFGKSDVHLCFAGHIDVVPAGDGWNSNPFVPMVENGMIYGRGTQDMKSGVAAFVQAAKDTKEFHGRLSLLLTSDEEGDATYGTQEMLRYLKSINLLPTHCIVAEPTCEKQFGDAIKVGRRGSINGILHLRGKQGHAAYPEKSDNPIHAISKILFDIAGVYLDNGDEYFSPSTLVVTDLRSGMEVTNVTPGTLKMMFNVRNSTHTTIDNIRSFVEEKLKGLDFTLELSQSAYPFITSSKGVLSKTITNAIEKYCHITPKYSTAGGTSDARFIAPYGVEVLEFGVINDTIHAPNEKVSIDEVEKLYKIFTQVVKNFPIKE